MSWASLKRVTALVAQSNHLSCSKHYFRSLPFTNLTQRTMATIYAEPATTLVDEKVQIRLAGFDPGSKVTVRSFLPEPGLRYEAHGHYVVDKNGQVCLDRQPSIGGTYTDTEPMGLFWSMIQSPGQRLGLRFAKKDVTSPMNIMLSVHRGHLDISDLQSDIPIAKTDIKRTYLGPDVEIIKVTSGRIRGRVFKPKGPGPFKGVIDMFGSSGGQTEFRAALLASRGFAAYALPYFRYEDLPKTFEKLDLHYFEEATDWLQNQSFVQPGGIGVCAVSYGGLLAAMMATNFPHKISACVSISGSCVCTTIPISYKGKEFPYLRGDWNRVNIDKMGDVPVINMYDVTDPLETAPMEALIQRE